MCGRCLAPSRCWTGACDQSLPLMSNALDVTVDVRNQCATSGSSGRVALASRLGVIGREERAEVGGRYPADAGGPFGARPSSGVHLPVEGGHPSGWQPP